MEIKYPFILITIPIVLITYLIISKKRKDTYTNGSKIANTDYIKKSKYYKNRIHKYQFIKITAIIFFISAIISSTLLLSRISETNTYNNELYNRDIFLCMDVSASVDKLNIELIDSLKKTVSKLHGERFGISIFNTSSIVLVPLTDDYEYVTNTLDQIKKSIKVNNPMDYGTYNGDDYLYISSYIYSGTIEGNEQRGSSLIGDGLASCVYSFSNLDEDRTRVIIFSTDNDLAGTPLFTLDKASQLSRSKGIKVFGIGTKNMKDANRTSFQNSVVKTGGKYYDHSKSTVSSIVDDIEKTSKSLLKNNTTTKDIDIPEIPFIILLISILGLVYMSKKV